MSPAVFWWATRLPVAVATIIVLGLLILGVIAPAIIWWIYRRNMPIQALYVPDIDQGAGSTDLGYWVGLYDVRYSDLVIRGTPPDADYWMIGVYDRWMLDIPTGHRNQDHITLEPDGTFEVVITARPSGRPNTLDVGRARRGMIMYRAVLPKAPIPEPTVEELRRDA